VIRSPAPTTVGETEPGDIVEIPDAFAPRVVRVEWHARGAHGAFCRRYSESARMPISGALSTHFLVPNHVEVLRVIDPDPPAYTAPEQGDPDATDR
jgi:hypothetical protein